MSLERKPLIDNHNRVYFLQLRRGSWFGGLPMPLAQSMFNAGHLAEYDAGSVIYNENAASKGIFGIIEGSVHMEMTGPWDNRVLIHVGLPSNWFGEGATASGAPTLIRARAFQRVKAWQIPQYAYRRILHDEPYVLEGVALLAISHLSAVLAVVCASQRASAASQVAVRLALLDRFYKESNPTLRMSIVPMTQGDLADMTGHSRQTVNTVLRQLEREGLVKMGHRRIGIREPKALMAYKERGSV